MTNRIDRVCRLALVAALAVTGASAHAQNDGAQPGISYAPPPSAEASPEGNSPAPRQRRTHGEIRPYLEVAQIVSTELDGGETLTYTNVAAGLDGRISTRSVRAAASYRYDRRISWGNDVADSDSHSGLAAINADIVPGLLQFDAAALATRTAGEGRAVGVTDRDPAAEVYAVYAGPTVSTNAGPVSVNAAYRLGYVKIDDDDLVGAPFADFEDSTTHSATASVGMAPGRGLPVGWTVGAGYSRSESGGDFEHEFEGAYVRGDVVMPVSPTLAVTAGVGYEDLRASQNDVARDSNGVPIFGPGGFPVADPSRPRLLSYDLDGIIYDAGIIWRPNPRTELQARAGHRYGGTTFVGTLSHQFSAASGLGFAIYDTVETFGGIVVNDLSNLPRDFEINRNPLTGGFGAGGCAFGGDSGGLCLDQSLRSIRGNTFRMRGASLFLSSQRGLWDFGLGAGYNQRRYFQPENSGLDLFLASEDEYFSLYASAGRQLSRSSQLSLDAYATWFDSNLVGSESVFSTGGTVSYHRRLLLDRLQLMSAIGLSHSESGASDSTVASGLLGLRYGF